MFQKQSPKDMAVVLDAIEFAQKVHAAQRRKYTGVPYFTHLSEVASLVSMVTNDPEMIASAYLHDSVEDTPTTVDEIRSMFGGVIANYVWHLTDVDKDYGNRVARKAYDRQRLAAAPEQVHTIKYADLISNSRSIKMHDPKFAQKYLEEKRLLLEVMTQGNYTLYEWAKSLI